MNEVIDFDVLRRKIKPVFTDMENDIKETEEEKNGRRADN